MKIREFMKKDKAQVMAALVCSVTAMAVNYLISLLLTPYITETLGKEAYGFVTLAKTVANYGIVITSCLNSFAARFIVVSYHEGDMEKSNRYYSSVLLADTVLFFIVSFLAAGFVKHLTWFFDVPEGLLQDVQILFFLDILNYLLLTVANVATVAGYVKNRLVYVNLIRIAGYLAEGLALVLAFVFLPAKVFYVGIALLVSTLAVGGLNALLKQKLTPELKCRLCFFSFSAVKDLIGRGVWNAFNQVGNLLNSGLDLWVTNRLLDGLAMGDLSIVKTVSTIFSTLPGLISSPFQPILLKAYAAKDREKVTETLKLEMKLTGLCGCLLLTGFALLGTSYYDLWTPGQDSGLLFEITMVTLVGFVFEGMANPLFYVYSLTLKNSLPCILTILSGILNVAGMYLLLRFTQLGLFAVVGTTTVLGFLTYFIFNPLYSAHCLEEAYGTFFPVMLRIAVTSFALAGTARLLLGDWTAAGWGKLILYAICIVIVTVPMYLVLVLSREEKRQVCNKLRKKN